MGSNPMTGVFIKVGNLCTKTDRYVRKSHVTMKAEFIGVVNL